MKLYELTYLIRPDLSEEEAKDFSQKINSFIQEEGGILERTTSSKKTNLAYPIKKGDKYLKTAYLSSLNLYLDPQKLKNLEEKLRKEKDILRASFFKKRLKKALETSRRIPRRKKAVSEKSKKVELKKIEEKIEELLK